MHRASPGTVVYSDATSLTQLPAEWGYQPAAVVISTVVSHPKSNYLTCDAGHKSVSADAGIPTCAVIGHPDLRPLKPSEEHLPIESERRRQARNRRGAVPGSPSRLSDGEQFRRCADRSRRPCRRSRARHCSRARSSDETMRLWPAARRVVCAFAQDPTAQLLTELLRVDNSNPPGNEARLADLLASKFRALGIDVEIIPTPDPKKAHFLARLKGDGSKRAVLLAGHADTVGVERDKWMLDPFAGILRDGYIYGRGAIDFKGGLAVFAQAVIQLHQNRIPLARDVILLSEADEEGGTYNTTWLAQNYWPKIDCEFALNEGGWIIANPDGRVRYVSISTADKTAVSLKLTARGTSTHSSMPRPTTRFLRSLARWRAWPITIPNPS